MILMIDWSLSHFPLEMHVWDWWVLWQESHQVEIEEVWVVQEDLGLMWLLVEEQRSGWEETSANTSNEEEGVVHIEDNSSGVEALDWELSNSHKTEDESSLGSVEVVEIGSGIRLEGWSGKELLWLVSWEPRFNNLKIVSSLISPFWKPLLNLMGGETETDELTILNVLWHLVVDHSSLLIIVGVLNNTLATSLVLLTCSSCVAKPLDAYL